MNKEKLNIVKTKDNIVNSLKDIECFLRKINKIDKISKLYKILKK